MVLVTNYQPFGSELAIKLQACGVVRHRRSVHHGIKFRDLSPNAAVQISKFCIGATPIADVVHAEEMVRHS